ncbi:hypothetical protein NEMIN01_2052 [Nematocida minor]|uniref:uncharacterized protein n=1 Tax=Nematocida minor TaxID=1912983 RepID=UPI00221E6CDD|nr:uncharacterized protein NEMIN01_2052 [Nematocida minor]KAI5192501.1 hypothetical protein NEMIN01_2052 [Nematocida minor]
MALTEYFIDPLNTTYFDTTVQPEPIVAEPPCILVIKRKSKAIQRIVQMFLRAVKEVCRWANMLPISAGFVILVGIIVFVFYIRAYRREKQSLRLKIAPEASFNVAGIVNKQSCFSFRKRLQRVITPKANNSSVDEIEY